MKVKRPSTLGASKKKPVSKKDKKPNVSLPRGVKRRELINRVVYTAETQVEGKKIFLGTFNTLRLAKEAYDREQKKLGRLPMAEISPLGLLAAEASAIDIHTKRGIVVEDGKYRAKIKIGSKFYSLGTFKYKCEAIFKYDNIARVFRRPTNGEYPNHPETVMITKEKFGKFAKVFFQVDMEKIEIKFKCVPTIQEADVIIQELTKRYREAKKTR